MELIVFWMDLNNVIKYDSRELDSLTQKVPFHPMPHGLVSVIHLWSPILHKHFRAGYWEFHILSEQKRYLFSKQVCIHALFSVALSSYSSWNWVFYGTRKSNGCFGILSAIVNSPSEVIIHCAIAGGCYGNNDDVHKNSVRDEASGAQGFLQSLRTCFQSSLINKDWRQRLIERQILLLQEHLCIRGIFWVLRKFSSSQRYCESVQFIPWSLGNEIFHISASTRPTHNEPHTKWIISDGAGGTTVIVCSCAHTVSNPKKPNLSWTHISSVLPSRSRNSCTGNGTQVAIN